MGKERKHPMQRIELDDHGVIRFRMNKIIRDAVDSGAIVLAAHPAGAAAVVQADRAGTCDDPAHVLALPVARGCPGSSTKGMTL